MRILLVEDDRKGARVLKKGLKEESFVVDVAETERASAVEEEGKRVHLHEEKAGEGPAFRQADKLVQVVNAAGRVLARSPALGGACHLFPASSRDNPGRVQFSHLRHFNALGEKQCKTCHSPEMGLVTSPSYASRAADPTTDPHGPQSLGRFCATCHNGGTRLSQVGTLRGRQNAPIFSAIRTGDNRSCQRCHTPADHGQDFTRGHARRAERAGSQACLPCHAQAWEPADRRLQANLLAAERTLRVHPDDPTAALAVGPNNFCVYCHRRDQEWQGDE